MWPTGSYAFWPTGDYVMWPVGDYVFWPTWDGISGEGEIASYLIPLLRRRRL